MLVVQTVVQMIERLRVRADLVCDLIFELDYKAGFWPWVEQSFNRFLETMKVVPFC